MTSKNNIKNSTRTENSEESIALNLREVIEEELKKTKEEINKAFEKISALEEMATVEKILYKRADPEKRSYLKDYLTNMAKSAIDSLKVPRRYEEIIKSHKYNQEKSGANEKFYLKLSAILKEVYLFIPEARYNPSESIDASVLAEEKSKLKSKILESIVKYQGSTKEEEIDYAIALSEDLSLSLIYGRNTAIAMHINNKEKNHPNTNTENPKVKRILDSIKQITS